MLKIAANLISRFHRLAFLRHACHKSTSPRTGSRISADNLAPQASPSVSPASRSRPDVGRSSQQEKV